MEKIVIFGKGGIGKSTFATNVSASLAASGRRVLHVGCDPKHDSTVALLEGRMIEAVVDKIQRVQGVRPEEIVTRSHLGIDCVEAGGPSAGVGCGGRGISRMVEIFQAAELIDDARYDVVIYDVLGDVVCGGFAAPLRKGVGDKVVIVASEELMALYAANNIARAVVHYAPNGIALAGIVFNLKDPDADREALERFARRINARVLGYVLRDPLVREAEYRRRTVVEHAPRSAIAQSYRGLAETMLECRSEDCPLPTPFDEVSFYHLAQTRWIEPDGGYRVGAAAKVEAPPPVEDAPEAPKTISLRTTGTRQREFQAEVEAGRRAVWRGLVTAPEAVRRLQQAFPAHAAGMKPEDLSP